MINNEELIININNEDLGRIDLLIQEGYYTDRGDFINSAIRSQLERQKSAVDSIASQKSIVIGTLSFNRHQLEKRLDEKQMINVKVIGILILTEDVTPQLALDTIQSLTVRGVIKAPEDVKLALKDRFH